MARQTSTISSQKDEGSEVMSPDTRGKAGAASWFRAASQATERSGRSGSAADGDDSKSVKFKRKETMKENTRFPKMIEDKPEDRPRPAFQRIAQQVIMEEKERKRAKSQMTTEQTRSSG